MSSSPFISSDRTPEEQSSAVIKLQSFVRGSLCRARVSDMLAILIQELLVAEQVSKASSRRGDVPPDHSSFTTLQSIETALINDEEEEVEMIDGLLFPKSIPSSVFDQSFQSLGSALNLTIGGSDQSDSSLPGTPSNVPSRIGIFQKGNTSSSTLESSKSLPQKEKGITVSTFKQESASPRKQDSVTSLGSAGSLKDQLGFSASDFDRCESPVYSVPFLKPVRRLSSKTTVTSKESPVGIFGDRVEAFESERGKKYELGSSMRSVNDTQVSKRDGMEKSSSVRDLIAQREGTGKKESSGGRRGMGGSSHSVASRSSRRGDLHGSMHSIGSMGSMSGIIANENQGTQTKNISKSALSETMAAFEGPAKTIEKTGASLFVRGRPQKSKSVPTGRQPATDPSSWIKMADEFSADTGASVAKTVASSVASTANNPPSRPLTIAERIHQLRTANRELSSEDYLETKKSKTERAVRRVDYTTKLYMMENSATKIQALARGYFYRKRTKEAQEATITVVKWLKQHRLLDQDASVSTLEMPEELRAMAVEALAAEIDQNGAAEESSEVEASEESNEDNEKDFERIPGLNRRQNAFEQETAPQSSKNNANMQSSPTSPQKKRTGASMLLERLRAFERYVEQEGKEETSIELQYKAPVGPQSVSKTLSTLNKKQHEAATKIQALVRGFIERKFDVHTMMTVVAWITEQQEQQKMNYDPDDFEPETARLETVWTFLESNNTWTKDKTLPENKQAGLQKDSDDDSINVLTEEEGFLEKINVNELLNTWEYLLTSKNHKEEEVTSPETVSSPSEKDLANLQSWMEDNHALVEMGGELGFLSTQKQKSASGSRDVRVMRTSKGVRAIKIGKSVNENRNTPDSLLRDNALKTAKELSDSVEKAQTSIASDKTPQSGSLRSKISNMSEIFQSNDVTVKVRKEPVTLLTKNGMHDVVKNSIVKARSTTGLDENNDNTIEAVGGNSTSTAQSCCDNSGKGIGLRLKDNPGIRRQPSTMENMQDLVKMWKWLASHGMDMKLFKQRQGLLDDSSEDIVRPLSFDPIYRSRTKEPFSAHRMHDDLGGKKDSIEYINDKDPTNRPLEPGYNMHKIHDEMCGSKGDGVVCIDEDRSPSYPDLGRASKSLGNVVQPRQQYSYNTHKMHDEMYDNSGGGVVYINEDLSSSYTGLGLVEQSRPKKPTMRAMVNYWNFSTHHSKQSTKNPSQESESVDETEMVLCERVDNVISQNQEVASEPKDWRTSAANNDFLGTLAWLKSKGVELNQVKSSSIEENKVCSEEGHTENEVANSVNEMSSKSDSMKDSLDWLQSKGYGRKSKKRTDTATKDVTNSHHEGAVSDRDSNTDSEGTDEDDSESSSNEDIADALLPKKADLSDTLKWLQSRGYRMPKHEITTDANKSPIGPAFGEVEEELDVPTAVPSPITMANALNWLEHREQEETKEDRTDKDHWQEEQTTEDTGGPIDHLDTVQKADEFKDVLQSLSWLKKHGFMLEKLENKQQVADDEIPSVEHVPTRKQIVEALGSINDEEKQPKDEALEEDAKGLSSLKTSKIVDDRKISEPKTNKDMEHTLAWLTKHGMKLPKKKKKHNPKNIKTNTKPEGDTRLKPMSTQKQDVVSVFSKMAKKTMMFDTSPTSSEETRYSHELDKFNGMLEVPQEQRKKTKARMAKVPNEVKKTSTPMNTDGMSSALQWLQFKKGITIDDKPKSSRDHTPESNCKGKEMVLTKEDQSMKVKSGRKTKRNSVSPVEISVGQAQETIENVFKLSNHPKGYGEGNNENSAPSSKDMEQALSWLKLRESRRQAQAAAVTFMPPTVTHLCEEPKASSDKAQVRVRKPKSTVDDTFGTKQVDDTDSEQPTSSLSVSNHEIKISSGQGKKKSQSFGYTPATVETESTYIARSNSKETKKKVKEDKSTDNKPSKSDMTKALMFLQQRRRAPAISRIAPVAKKEVAKPTSPSKRKKQTKQAEMEKSNLNSNHAGVEASKLKEDNAGEKEPRTKEERDYYNALNFLCGNAIDAQEDEPYFEKLDSILPLRSAQSKEARAREMAKALKWIKKQGVTISGTKPASTKPAQTEAKSIKDTSQHRSSDKEDTLGSTPSEEYRNCVKWLTSSDRDSIPDANHFKKLDSMLPKKTGQNPSDRARDMVKALEWVKKSAAKKNGNTSQPGETTPKNNSRKSSKSPGRRMSKSPGQRPDSKSPRTKAKPLLTVRKGKGKRTSASAPPSTSLSMDDADAQNALRWLKKENHDKLDDATNFKKLDSMLPKKAGQTLEQRAVEMSKALKLIRKRDKGSGMKPPLDPNPAPSAFNDDEKKAYLFLMAKITGKDHMSMEDADVFKRVDNMMPSKEGQAPEDRAKEMVKMMTWLKKKGKI